MDKLIFAFVLLTCLTACAAPQPPAPPPIPVIKLVYPDVPANILTCSDEPVPGEILTDVSAAKFTEAVRLAGGDCRSKLATVKKTVDSWPHP